MSMKVQHPSAGRRLHTPHSVRFRTSEDDSCSNYKETESSTGGQTNTADSVSSVVNMARVQPATIRYKTNEQRIKLLHSINEIVEQRAQLEASRTSLTSLLDELRRKLRRKIEECQLAKKEQIRSYQLSNSKLERERTSIIHELEHLGRHLEREETHHLQHARAAAARAIQGHVTGVVPSANLFVSCVADLPSAVARNVARHAPSRMSDSKLQAARLMRDIAELRQRAARVDGRLAHEIQRKKQVETDILCLRKRLSMTKSDMASLRLPLPPLRKPCAHFA